MSRYENYAIKNNVFGTLSAPISSLATTIQLGDGQGQRFSVNQLATLENIENGKVMKREIVLITAINGDVLTVERKYAPCPSNDDANTQGRVSYAFSTDDTISAYIDKEHFDRIDDSINDIYDNGVNKLRTEVISGLQIKVNAGPVLVGSGYYDFAGGNLTLTDNATNYIEIDEDGLLVSNTTARGDKHTKISKVTTSGGQVVSIEDWRLGTVGGEIGGVNIHDLTEKESLSPDDEFIIADSDNIYNNKKIKYNNIVRTIGDGSDGDLTITEPTQIEAKEYNFNNLTICSGGILAFCGNGVPIIRVRECFCNLGKIDLMGDIQNDNGIFAIMGGNVYLIKNVVGPAVSIKEDGGNGGTGGQVGCGGTGGKGGAAGCPGCNGETQCNAGGIGGAAGICSGGGGGGGGGSHAAGCPGCPGGNCIGGNGGNMTCYYGGGGGGGYGYLRGGDGGCAMSGGGGSGGDSYYCGGNGGNGSVSSGSGAVQRSGGDGGFGFMCCGGNGGNGGYNTKGGNGGGSFRGKGGNGGNGVNNNYCKSRGGDGGDTFFGRGGDGGNGCPGGNGGNGRSGGNGGSRCSSCGGNARGGRYGLLLVVNDGYNTCIDGGGGDGGNGYGSGCGGNASNGAVIHILYKCGFDCGQITYLGGKGGSGGTAGTDGKDGKLRIGKITV